jgi:glutaredoxin-related protein
MTKATDLLSQLNETKVDLRSFGKIGPAPKKYLHYTNSSKQLQQILQNGFSTRFFGQTAKKLNQLDLAKNDPVGIYALSMDDEQLFIDKNRPWVIFTLTGSPMALSNPNSVNGLKHDLAAACGFAGKRLTNALIKAGIDVLLSNSESIILDLSKIRILESSQ